MGDGRVRSSSPRRFTSTDAGRALRSASSGACAGTSYVTGFTVLQETVNDELRGRTFATLYTVIRLCLLVSLVLSPLWADFWDWFVGLFGSGIGDARRRRLLVPRRAHRALGRRARHVRRGFWARHSVHAARGSPGRMMRPGTSPRVGRRHERRPPELTSAVRRPRGRRGRPARARRPAASRTRLRAAGHDVVETFEPGATPLGERLRELLLARRRTRSTRSPRRC